MLIHVDILPFASAPLCHPESGLQHRICLGGRSGILTPCIFSAKSKNIFKSALFFSDTVYLNSYPQDIIDIADSRCHHDLDLSICDRDSLRSFFKGLKISFHWCTLITGKYFKRQK